MFDLAEATSDLTAPTSVEMPSSLPSSLVAVSLVDSFTWFNSAESCSPCSICCCWMRPARRSACFLTEACALATAELVSWRVLARSARTAFERRLQFGIRLRQARAERRIVLLERQHLAPEAVRLGVLIDEGETADG
jgi:hypothetical protein